MTAEKISDLYIDEISAAVQLLRSGTGKQAQKMPTILHFSDIHNSQHELERIIRFADECQWLITDLLHTGDSVARRFMDGIPAFSLPGAQRILNIVGNHDALSAESGYDWSNRASNEALYNMIFKPFSDVWGVQMEENTTYWYKDYESYGFRLIGIDNTLWDDPSQLSWLDSVLSSARELGFFVVIATHYPPNNRVKIFCGFTSVVNDYPGKGKSCINEQLQEIVQHFIEAGGEFVCYLSGHTHTDYLWYNENFPQHLCVTIDSASVSHSNHWGDTYRVKGTKSEDLFNLFSFDLQQKMIKIVRIGANVNSAMQRKSMISVNYKTMQVCQPGF